MCQLFQDNTKKAFKLPFGLKNGEIIDVSKVQNGLRCDCICPSCKSPLIARKGSKTSHHFAHYKAPECQYGYETAIHLMSKKILQNHKKIKLPKVIANFGTNSYRKIQLYADCSIEFDDVYLEKKIDNFIPDIILIKNDKKLLVEIAVTHFIDEIKLKKIKDQKISTIEINLSKENRTINEELLTDILINGLDHKRWIYNLKWNESTKKLSRFAESLKIFNRGFTKHIDYCPLNLRNWQGKSYANFFDDCPDCNYYFGEKNQNEIYCLGTNRTEVDRIIKHHEKKGCS